MCFEVWGVWIIHRVRLIMCLSLCLIHSIEISNIIHVWISYRFLHYSQSFQLPLTPIPLPISLPRVCTNIVAPFSLPSPLELAKLHKLGFDSCNYDIMSQSEHSILFWINHNTLFYSESIRTPEHIILSWINLI